MQYMPTAETYSPEKLDKMYEKAIHTLSEQEERYLKARQKLVSIEGKAITNGTKNVFDTVAHGVMLDSHDVRHSDRREAREIERTGKDVSKLVGNGFVFANARDGIVKLDSLLSQSYAAKNRLENGKASYIETQHADSAWVAEMQRVNAGGVQSYPVSGMKISGTGTISR